MPDGKDWVRTDTTKLFAIVDGKRKGIMELLWGDLVHVQPSEDGDPEGTTRVKARGATGLVDTEDLGGTPLLEMYFIDVGQGDGVFIRTPDGKSILIDGGFMRSRQPTKKNAADFIDWKFFKDYLQEEIELDVMIASHCDADHYGGLWDLINPEETEELDIGSVPRVRAFYHAGVGWWTNGEERNRSLGRKDAEGFLTDLISDRDSLIAERDGLTPQGQWGEFLRCVHALECDVAYLGRSQEGGYMPGFTPDDGDVRIRVLAPLDAEGPDGRRIEYLKTDSQTTNGHSILLRVDYHRTRTLLTGDLNAASQRRILEAYTGHRQELAADVTKGCHHGSDDVSYEFLSAINAACTIISSGDNESHAHPRPAIVAASAQTGFTRIDKDRLVTPLVYSTEISRSYKLAAASAVVTKDGEDDVTTPADEVRLKFPREKKTRALNRSHVVTGVVYGLVNVRTDGNRILCATLNELEREWEVESFESRF